MEFLSSKNVRDKREKVEINTTIINSILFFSFLICFRHRTQNDKKYNNTMFTFKCQLLFGLVEMIRWCDASIHIDNYIDDWSCFSAVYPQRPGSSKCVGDKGQTGQNWRLWAGTRHRQRLQLRCERKRM